MKYQAPELKVPIELASSFRDKTDALSLVLHEIARVTKPRVRNFATVLDSIALGLDNTTGTGLMVVGVREVPAGAEGDAWRFLADTVLKIGVEVHDKKQPDYRRFARVKMLAQGALHWLAWWDNRLFAENPNSPPTWMVYGSRKLRK